VRASYVNFNNFIVDADPAAGTPDTLDSNGNPVLVRITGRLQDVGPDLLAPPQTFQGNKQTKGSEPTRVGQGSGTFSPGIQRAFQFGIRVSF